MKKIGIIAWRDFKSYFTSPIAYIVVGAFIAIMGYMFFFSLDQFYQANFKHQMSMGRSTTITDGIVRPFFGNMNVILLFIIPFITMRLFAEERKVHSIELLLTSPVTLWQIIFGKFFSAFLLVLFMLFLTLVYPGILFATGNPDPGPILTSYLGTLFMAGCFLSVGILFSSMTENQIVAGALTFATCLFFWLINWPAHSATPIIRDLLNYLSLVQHYGNFGKGLLNSVDIVYYSSFIGVSLFLTHRVLDSYRWRS